ncbi:MAG TPA: YihY/virulence factor BrkB family protein, partial [Myxococcales bacterium]|nr:YihY/virulence factor BrkB family protein [Myxococcales bacterium]
MSPSKIPAVEFIKKLARRYSDNAVGDRAAQLTYYFLFALFPAIFFCVTLAAYLPIQGALNQLLDRLREVVPAQAMTIVQDQLTNLATRQRPHFLWLGVALALWSASRGIDAVRTALNLSYDVKETRPFWKTQGLALLLTVGTGGLMLLAVGALAVGGNAGMWLAAHLHVDKVWAVAWSWARFPLMGGVVMFVIAVLYYFLPDVKQEWKFITPGSMIGTVLWLVASYGFSVYVANFGSYDKTYGSIGGVMVMMTWLYLTGLIFIIGGEINAVLEHSSDEGKVM